MKIKLWGALSIAIALVFAGTAVADPGADKAQAERELAEAEATLEGATDAAREAGQALADVEAKLPDAHERVNAARGNAASAQVTADAAADAAADARERHAAAEDDYTDAEVSVDGARDELGESVKLTYEGRGLIALNLVLEAPDLIEASERMVWVKEIVRRQDDALDEVLRLRQDARDAENDAEVANDDALAAEDAAEDALADAKADLAEAQDAEDDLESLVDTQQSALDAAEAERDDSLDQYEEAQEHSDRIADALRDAGADDGPAPDNGSERNSSGFVMPVGGWKSSDYGNRYDPYYHVWQLHAGTDFAAGGGAPIYAVAAGTVNQAGWNGGYGNYTCIYHGDNVSTCYAHQSRIGVSVGQNVDQGQHIGDVGTTGASTGSHLHFEVRVNGSPVQPLDWLPSCLC
jgi:murein DD-endopeptidase MepM/ murein hydrolase activator NlpD